MLMIGKQLTEEQRLTKAVVDIMNKQDRYTALAGVLMIGERKVCDDTPTAKTNGRDEWYGREFVAGLSDAELRFLILHEVYHKLYKHLTTWQHLYEENPQVANMACDYVINLKIADENTDGFAVMPEVGLMDEQYRGMNAADVYKKLKQDQEQNGNGQGQGQGSGEPGEGQASGQGGGMDEHDWAGAQELSDEEAKQLEREIDEAIRQGALLAGKVGSGGMRDLNELLQAKVDWREELREFVSTTCVGSDYSTWRRPNRRYISSDVYMPTSLSESMGELVVAIDTSGSIGSRELSQFLGEIKSVCDTVMPDKVRVLYWDTAVCREEVYEQSELENLVTSTKPEGGGGTHVQCVVDYMMEHTIRPQAVLVFTDGYLGSDWGSGWTAPLMWCILDNKSARPKIGKYLHVELD